MNDKAILTRNIVEKINNYKKLSFKLNQNLESTAIKASVLGWQSTRLNEDFLAIENETQIILMSDKQIELSNMTKDGTGLFSCTVFTAIDFSDTDTSDVTDMCRMFKDCSATELNLESFNTSNVKIMSSMFNNCSVKSLNLKNFDTRNVEYMVFMFKDTNIKKLDLSSFNTEKVVDMQYMFNYCNSRIIDISSFKTTEETKIVGMFYGARSSSMILVTDKKINEALNPYGDIVIDEDCMLN